MIQAVLNDPHVPYHDPAAVNLTFEILKGVNPHRIDLLGDILDNRLLSTKFKSTPKDRRFARLQDELRPTRRLLERIRERHPRAVIVYHEGNHEARLTRWIADNAPALEGVLDFPTLLGLPDLGISHRDYGHLERVGSLNLTHGTVVRSKSGTSALAMLDRYGCNIMCGHTHRLSAVYETTGKDIYGAWENGCLCRPSQHYTIGPNNWQQGFSIVTHVGDRFTVEQVPIVRGKAVYAGRLYAASEIKNPICKGIAASREGS